jgi:hypothetical protein
MRNTAASKNKSLYQGCRVSQHGANHPPTVNELPAFQVPGKAVFRLSHKVCIKSHTIAILHESQGRIGKGFRIYVLRET